MSDESIFDMVKRQVNAHGELHLDAVFTGLLLEFIKNFERIEENHKAIIQSLRASSKGVS